MKNKLYRSTGEAIAFYVCVIAFIAGLYLLLSEDEGQKSDWMGWVVLVVLLSMLPIFVFKRWTDNDSK